MSSGQTSPLGYFERMDDDSFDEASPVSAASAWLLRNNLSHLRDMCTQQRIAASESIAQDTWYFDGLAPNGTIVAGTDSVATWWQRFPHTWFAPRVPTNLDVGAGVRFSGNMSGRIRVRVVPHYSPRSGRMVPIGTGTALVDDDSTVVSGSNYGATLQPHMFTEADAARIRIAPTTYDGVLIENGEFALPQVLEMRLEVTITRTDAIGGTVLPRMAFAYVREFA